MTRKFTDDQIMRYSRQIILPEVGGTGQRKLLNSKVLVTRRRRARIGGHCLPGSSRHWNSGDNR